MKKKKNAKKWLLLIPVQAILSVLIIFAGSYGDTLLFSNAENAALGHPAPVFTLLGFVVAVALFVLVTIVSIIVTILESRKNKKSAGQKALR